MVNIAFALFNIFRFYFLHIYQVSVYALWHFIFSEKIVLEQIFVPICISLIYGISGYYNRPYGKSRVSELATTLKSTAFITLALYFGLLINDSTGLRIRDYELIVVVFVLLFCFTYLGRWIITSLTIMHLRARRWKYITLVIGNSKESRELCDKLKKSGSAWTYDVIGYISLNGEPGIEDNATVWDWEEVEKVCSENNVDQIIIAPGKLRDKRLMTILERLFPLRIPVKISPDTISYITGDLHLDDILGMSFIDLTLPRISEFEKNVKRLTDITVSLLTMIILAPILAVIALTVKLTSRGPVIYSQQRMGKDHIPFKIYKFRSMRTDAESGGPMLSSDNDPRVTPWGRFMRKYRIDELPQFWNVLRGDMSLVGPRPEREYFIEQILKKAPYYALIFQVRPGVTSWGMVKYGYASDVEQMVARSRYDLLYINNMSLGTDLKIIIHTIRTVLLGKGV